MTTTDRKQVYQDRIEAELKQRRAELDQLIARGRKAQADARIDFDKELEELQKQLESTEEKFQHLKESGEESWEEIKAGFSGAWDALQNSFQKAKSKF